MAATYRQSVSFVLCKNSSTAVGGVRGCIIMVRYIATLISLMHAECRSTAAITRKKYVENTVRGEQIEEESEQ